MRVGTDYLGAEVPLNGVEVDQFVENDRNRGHYYGTFTHRDCFPVHDHFRGVHEQDEAAVVELAVMEMI